MRGVHHPKIWNGSRFDHELPAEHKLCAITSPMTTQNFQGVWYLQEVVYHFHTHLSKFPSLNRDLNPVRLSFNSLAATLDLPKRAELFNLLYVIYTSKFNSSHWFNGPSIARTSNLIYALLFWSISCEVNHNQICRSHAQDIMWRIVDWMYFLMKYDAQKIKLCLWSRQ